MLFFFFCFLAIGLNLFLRVITFLFFCCLFSQWRRIAKDVNDMLDDTPPSSSTPSPTAPKPHFMRQLGVSGSPEKEVPAAAAAAAAAAATAAPEKEKKRVRSYDVESTTDCSDQEEGVDDDDKGYSEEMEYGTADEQQEPNVWESESVKEKEEEEDDGSGMKLRDVTKRSRRKKMKTWKSE